MPWQDSAGDLIAAIYDTVIDTSRWEEVVRRIVEATNFISGALLPERQMQQTRRHCAISIPFMWMHIASTIAKLTLFEARWRLSFRVRCGRASSLPRPAPSKRQHSTMNFSARKDGPKLSL